jgi:hypothetical protein
MKAGDKVRIVKGDCNYFRIGDIATLTYLSESGNWWGDFNNHGNDTVCDDGRWCITQCGECEILEASQ